MGLIFLVLLGMAMGWLATILFQAGENGDLGKNVASGIGGALLAGSVINPLIGLGNILRGGYSPSALLVALAGAIVLLLAVNLLRCREMR